jgi:hypothetical protein
LQGSKPAVSDEPPDVEPDLLIPDDEPPEPERLIEPDPTVPDPPLDKDAVPEPLPLEGLSIALLS